MLVLCSVAILVRLRANYVGFGGNEIKPLWYIKGY